MVLGVVLGARVLIDLSLRGDAVVANYDDPWLQAIAALAAVMRWVPVALLLVAGARATLGLTITDAATAAAVALTGIWLGPVLAALVPASESWNAALVAAATAITAGFSAWLCARAGRGRLIGFALVAALVVTIDATWTIAHAWIADLIGMAVRGALLPGMSPPERAIYGMVPMLLIGICLVVAAGRNDGGFPRRALILFFGPAFGGFAALGVVWGFLFASQQAGYGLDVLHPPAVYAPVLALMSLWLFALSAVQVARRQRRYADAPAAIDCFALLVLGALLGAPVGGPFLLLAGLTAGLGLCAAWSLGRPRLPPWSGPPIAGIAAVLLYAVGFSVATGVQVESVLERGIAIAGVFAIGASLGAIALLGTGPAAERRLPDQIWTVNLMAAFAIVFAASGVRDPMVWVGLGLSWAALAILALGPRGSGSGQRLMLHALPFAWALAILAILGLLVQQISVI